MNIFHSAKKPLLEAKVTSPFTRFRLLLSVAVILCAGGTALAQEWVKAQTGIGVSKAPRIAVADFAARNAATKNHSALFTQVVRDDLQFSGILELVSPSFYPQQMPSIPAELKNTSWTDQ